MDERFLALAVIGLPAVVVILMISTYRQKQHDLVRRALIDKFGSAQDLGAFLQTESGKRFLADLAWGAGGALGTVLTSVRTGVILVLVGAGCAGASAVSGQGEAIGMTAGLVLLFAGVGFIISAAVTYALTKRWGMLEK